MSIELLENEIYGAFKTTTQAKDYQREIISNIVQNLKQANDVAIQLPTGTGKSFVYIPLAIAASQKGLRVCILAPTNLIVDQIEKRYIKQYFNTNLNPQIAKGIEHYTCLITNCHADYAICTPEQRESICKTQYSSCKVLEVNKLLEEHNLIITNFHKFLSTQIEKHFDLIIIDDSHGFENALESKFLSRIEYYQISNLFESHNSSADAVADVTGFFLDKFDDILDSFGPNDLSKRISNEDIKAISEIEGTDKLKALLPNLNVFERSVSYQLIRFIETCKRLTMNTFYAEKYFYNPDDRMQSTLLTLNSKVYRNKILDKSFDSARVVFSSATMGDIERHAHYCTNRNYSDGTGLVVLPSNPPDIIKNWFKDLHIFEITDYQPDKDPLELAVSKANEIMSSNKGKTLLLFKNYRDQHKAQEILNNKFSQKIAFIDDSFDTESVQNLVDKSEIIMATASSRLWEGIDIQDLTFEFIFSLPFIRPPVYMDKNESLLYTKRKMLIKLQQGIGRLIRKDNDKGICVVFDKRLNKYKNNAEFSTDYRNRIVEIEMNSVTNGIEQIVNSWK